MEFTAPYLDDTTAIEKLLQVDQGLTVNTGFANSSYYKPIHLAAELGKNFHMNKAYIMNYANLVNQTIFSQIFRTINGYNNVNII